jgi:hypothetical protein
VQNILSSGISAAQEVHGIIHPQPLLSQALVKTLAAQEVR